MEQAPCPDRIVDDFGSAFLMGAVGGGALHTFKGYRNAPKNYKWAGTVQNVTLRAPTVGGNFAVWGGLFSTFDCSLTYLRGTHDSWNAILAGGFTGGVLAARAGARAAGKNFIIGAALLAVIEGLSASIGKLMEGFAADPNNPIMSESVKKTMLKTDITKQTNYAPPPAFSKFIPKEYGEVKAEEPETSAPTESESIFSTYNPFAKKA